MQSYFEQVKHVTDMEYFNGNVFSIDATGKKYKQYPEETYVMGLWRVAQYIASAEPTEELKQYWAERWFREMYDDIWKPGGSIMEGAGSDGKISLLNCTHISLPEDSLEGIIAYNGYRVAKSAAYRQGLGVHFGKIRPRNTKVNNSSKVSQGVVHWMRWLDNMANFIGQQGRIPAFLFSNSCDHPDIEEFIESKADMHSIQNANLSIHMFDKFYEAVRTKDKWELKFIIPAIQKGDKIYLDPHIHDLRNAYGFDDIGWYQIAKHERPEEIISKTVDADELFTKMVTYMFLYAEPAFQNMDVARRYSNSDAVGFPILGSNACSEAYLDDQGHCDLGSLNALAHIINGIINWKMVESTTQSMVRFLDDVITKEIEDGRYATYEQLRSLKNLRRLGLGIADVAGMLFKFNLEYGSPEANKVMNEFTDNMCYYAYKYSVELGKEKGSYEAFDPEKIKNSLFIKNFTEKHPDIELTHMRNVTLMAIAPLGTLTLTFRRMALGYSFEPGFGMYYWKRTRVSGAYKYYFIVPAVVREMFENAGHPIPISADTIEDTWDGKRGLAIIDFIEKHKDEVGIKFKMATEIDPMDKLNLMAEIQKSVDGSISTTFMLPKTTSIEKLKEFVLKAHELEVKSIASFQDKKLYGIVSYIPFKQLAFDLKKSGVSMHPSNFSDEEAKELMISSETITDTKSAPKRPKKLEADVYTVIVKGEKFLVSVGLLNDKPYEIFCCKPDFEVNFKERKGTLEKLKRGIYKLVAGDLVIENISDISLPKERVLFRMVSTSLRHGIPIRFICEQLNKSTDDMFSLTSASSRVLKKYIKDGEKVTGRTCPVCGGTDFTYDQGCPKCVKCGNSKCD